MRLVHVMASFSGDVFVDARGIVSGAVERLEIGYEGHSPDVDCRSVMVVADGLDELPEFVNDVVWRGWKVWYGSHEKEHSGKAGRDYLDRDEGLGLRP